MWISINVMSSMQEVIYMPESIANKFDPEVYISFGQKIAKAKVKSTNDLKVVGGSTFKFALRIEISNKLQSKLQIPVSLIYQMKFNKNHIVIGPVIGLLLGSSNYLYNPHNMKGFSDHFKEAYKMGGLFYAFSSRGIDWDNMTASGFYYNYTKDVWQFGNFPLPAAIYVRSFHAGSGDIKKLIDVSNGKLFNSLRFSKFHLYQYVSNNIELNEYLPPTELSNDYEQIKSFIDDYKYVILKPIHLSRGRGICIIKKTKKNYKIYDYRANIPTEKVLADDTALENFFEENKIFFNRYIIQKYLSLAKIDGSPFDIRIVMQKDRTGAWKCTGIECRVAKQGNLLTNISRGGYALSIDEALKKAFPDFIYYNHLKKQLHNLCHKLCLYLDEAGQHFAEFGMDIALDENKKLWIIEVNVLPGFKGFKQMDYKTYLNIRYNPISYAANLAGF